MKINLHDIFLANQRIKDFIVKTPLSHSYSLSLLSESEIWFKLENLQKTGSFKIRGALNKITLLNETEKKKGVITASAGNHAQGVALAAKHFGVLAKVVVPKDTPDTKKNSIKKLGAELIIHGANYDEAELHAYRLSEKLGMTFIHAFEDKDVICGQGTIGLECLLESPDFDIILVPAGGGGLISGIAIAAKSINPNIKVIGIQSEASPPWYYSFKAKKLVDVTYKKSIADGLHGGIGKENLKLALNYIDDFILVTEKEIEKAMSWLATEYHYMVEGSGAVGIAAILNEKIDVKNKKVLNVISGGNVDAKVLANIITSNN
ncbi:threonine ammonia-lyase [Priestia sp. FSL R5-0680]|uniref:threonine ammonia-lyase n=1 Tax=Priestia sp. FSL R5-0680 TaxID=2921582 RepID=UPI0030F8A330